MADYSRGDARDWARENMKGICGCLLPTLSTSLRAVNEAAVRHDVRLSAGFGYWGTLLVPECGTTDDEMREVMDIAVDEAEKSGIRTMLLASFPTLEVTKEMIGYAESVGVDMVMTSYPATFRPRSERDVYDFTRELCGASDLGVMLFAIHHWDFERLHPSGFSSQLIEDLVNDCETVVAIKNEVGRPGVGGQAEVFARFNDRVVVSDPFEENAPAWTSTYGMEFMGTANYEYFGRELVDYFDLLQDGDLDGAMKLYWKLQPARLASKNLTVQTMAGTNLVHRLMWKYKGWLNGFNGGPTRGPQARLLQSQMNTLRGALVQSGIAPAPGEDDDFFIGRNPME
ncbi:dihydrodipicolinate synthase family protein [Nocardioides sp. KR10-350]|uniref:dihydrodipicolinate synthase family protein n=1 Tax=Nocardioides cheoyonin TaxID=3156615 RepID=UPI0032B4992E